MYDLDSISLRILGSLVEKQSTTPDQYPLSLNSLLNACNQKSSRNPVMSLTTAEVGPRLRELEEDDWLKREYGSRTEKYSHRVNIKLDLTKNKMAVVTVLMLRGPLTLGEIRTNSARLTDFDSLDAVSYYVNQLIERDQPLVEQMPRQPGESADRYQQLLSPIIVSSTPTQTSSTVAQKSALTPKVAQVAVTELQMIEARFKSMEQRIDALEKLIADDESLI